MTKIIVLRPFLARAFSQHRNNAERKENVKEKVKLDNRYKVVFVRTGQSANPNVNFTGWIDKPLNAIGKKEAILLGRSLRKKNYNFDVAFTSSLNRAQETLALIMEELDIVPQVHANWRLNDRHYGALSGLSKKEAIKTYGQEKVMSWTRSLMMKPPRMQRNSPLYQQIIADYNNILSESQLPNGESHKMTSLRVLPIWNSAIWPIVQRNQKVLIVGHNASLLALINYLDDVEENILNVELPTGIPFTYGLDEYMRPVPSERMKFILPIGSCLKPRLPNIEDYTRTRKVALESMRSVQ